MINISLSQLKKVDDYRWLIPPVAEMRVPGLIYTTEAMLTKVVEDKALDQVANVATLPGIVGKSLAMPDIHWGYGFCIGGVAAMNVADGVISPGGIGYDISCGVRLLRTNLEEKDLTSQISLLVERLFRNIPSGVGATGKLNLSKEEVKQVLKKGARWAVEHGFGDRQDLEYIEDQGCLEEADPDLVSSRALERGREQLGTLGSGNHFLEIQKVEEIYDQKVAEAFGIFPGQVTVMIHTGSRGCGYQICDDYLSVMGAAAQKYNIFLPDRQLACAPINSDEGQRYFAAMSAGANYARANRQIIAHWVKESFLEVLAIPPKELGMQTVYDVAHNLGKMEEHFIDDKKVKVCVHRKGATRSLPAGHKDVPDVYRAIGQPVLIPGTMGTASYILVGSERALKETFASTCHGAGRMMSRSKALKQVRGQEVQKQLKEKGIIVRSGSYKGLAEEAPFAYKDVSLVVEICHQAGLSRKVAKLRPLGVIKG